MFGNISEAVHKMSFLFLHGAVFVLSLWSPGVSTAVKLPPGFNGLNEFVSQNALTGYCNTRNIEKWGKFKYTGASGPGTGFAKPFQMPDWSALHTRTTQDVLGKKLISRVVLQPGIQKCGSTSVTGYLKDTWEKDADLLTDDPEYSSVTKDTDLNADAFFFAIIRDPIDHALAGFHQVYVFYLMGWLDGHIRRQGIQFWNKTCISTDWGKKEKYPPCMGTAGDNLDLMVEFLDEVEEKGYWDPHIYPITFAMHISEGPRMPHFYAFDIKNLGPLFGNFSKILLKEAPSFKKKKSMSRMSKEDAPWTMTKSELIARSSKEPEAKDALLRLCALYLQDYECLHMSFPFPTECKPILNCGEDSKSTASVLCEST
eukprot:m.179936 g.179936  ORF g.179936 m.179936 type:complete len:371 (+) comp18401_c1_seq2:164-1276(+)